MRREKIYFIGIAGTGMGPVAGLLKLKGFEVVGSDQQVYPPMSTMLDNLNISVLSPFSAANITSEKPDIVVVGNSLSAKHPEVLKAQELGIALKSYPQILGEFFLEGYDSLVVTGTHGKTTTTALLVHLFKEFALAPSYLIGGVPKGQEQSFALTTGEAFILEGDEYDTAFFDKESKFLHYRPDFLIFNNLEYDHADIFKDLKAIEKMFGKLLNLVKNKRQIIANISDPAVLNLLTKTGLLDEITPFALKLQANDYDNALASKCYLLDSMTYNSASGHWHYQILSPNSGLIEGETTLYGEYNGLNICAALALFENYLIKKNFTDSFKEKMQAAIASFAGVKKRLDFLGKFRGMDVYLDFAHHPSAVCKVLQSYRAANPQKRLIAAFEPKNASSRRNTFSDDYVRAFSSADVVLLGPAHEDVRIPANERMETKYIANKLGIKAHAMASNTEVKNWLETNASSGDAVIFMSCGDFSSVPLQLVSEG